MGNLIYLNYLKTILSTAKQKTKNHFQNTKERKNNNNRV